MDFDLGLYVQGKIGTRDWHHENHKLPTNSMMGSRPISDQRQANRYFLEWCIWGRFKTVANDFYVSGKKNKTEKMMKWQAMVGLFEISR